MERKYTLPPGTGVKPDGALDWGAEARALMALAPGHVPPPSPHQLMAEHLIAAGERALAMNPIRLAGAGSRPVLAGRPHTTYDSVIYDILPLARPGAPMPRRAELRSYEPSWREKVANALMGQHKPSPGKRRFVTGLMGTEGRLGVADAFPFTAPLFALNEAVRDGNAQDVAMAVVPGARLAKPAAKRAKKAVDGAAATVRVPAVRTGEKPIFDYSRLHEVPDVPQFDLKRYDPPRGVPERTKAIAHPDNLARVREVVERGRAIGGERWFNTEPLRQAFIGELGAERGAAAFERFIDYVAATSTRSRVGENIRNASYYYTLDRQGLAFPKIVRPGDYDRLEKRPPFPYGHRYQVQHAKNARKVRDAGGWELFVLESPKTASFAQNLKGNQQPVTIDLHNTKVMGLTDAQGRLAKAPGKNEYGFMEALQQGEAPKLALSPAQYQSSAWVGGAEQTGQRSGIDPFLRIFESRLMETATRLGLSKEEVLRRTIRGELPLYGAGGIMGLGVLAEGEANRPGSNSRSATDRP